MIEQFEGIKGAIFDIDGTILDSMEIWDQTGLIFLDKLNIKGDKNLGKILFTKTTRESATHIKERYKLDMNIEKIMEEINEVALEFYRQEAKLKPNMEELLREMKAKGIKVTAATSTDRHIIMPALNRLDLTKYFDEIYTCTEIGKSKNEPDIFYEAMEFMETEPKDTWLFEDGLYSAKTGKKIGMKVVGVYDKTSEHDWEELRNLADQIISFI